MRKATASARAVFLDRDGVINVDRGYVHRAADFQLIDGVIDGLLTLQTAGYLLLIVTNQAGIGRGFYTEDDFLAFSLYVDAVLKSKGVYIARTYYCPHHPDAKVTRYRVACDCRKPQPGMLLRARDEFGIDMSRSAIVGDKATDVLAGQRAGVATKVLVGTGHQLSLCDMESANAYFSDLPSAASWLTSMGVR